MKKRVTFQSETLIKKENNEVEFKESHVVFKFPKEPEYVKVYTKDIASLYNLSSLAYSVLMTLATSMPFDGVIRMTKGYRESIAQAVGSAEKSVKNIILTLCNKGIMARTGSGDYMLNPALFAKGDWYNIAASKDTFSLIIGYKENGERVVLSKKINKSSFEEIKQEVTERINGEAAFQKAITN